MLTFALVINIAAIIALSVLIATYAEPGRRIGVLTKAAGLALLPGAALLGHVTGVNLYDMLMLLASWGLKLITLAFDAVLLLFLCVVILFILAFDAMTSLELITWISGGDESAAGRMRARIGSSPLRAALPTTLAFAAALAVFQGSIAYVVYAMLGTGIPGQVTQVALIFFFLLLGTHAASANGRNRGDKLFWSN